MLVLVAALLSTTAPAPAGGVPAVAPAVAPTAAPAAAPAVPPAVAPAAEASRILVVAPAVDEAARVEELYTGLRAAGLLPVELEEREGVDREGPPPPAPGTLDGARAALATARARFRDLDLDGARAALEAARAEILRLERPEAALEVLVDALLLEAHVALQSGADDEADAALALVSRLEPTRDALDAGLYPPSLVAAYEGARRVERAAPPGALVARPRVARFLPFEVLVDARAAAPDTALRAGPHLVTLRAPGALPSSRIVTLAADEPLVLEPFLAPADVVEARRRAVTAAAVNDGPAAMNDAGLVQALGEVAGLSAARAVLFIGVARAALFIPGRGIEALPVAATAPGVELGRATLAALQAPARREVGLPPRGGGVDWTAAVVGGGVAAVLLAGAAVATSLWALLPAGPPPDPPRPVVVICCGD